MRHGGARKRVIPGVKEGDTAASARGVQGALSSLYLLQSNLSIPPTSLICLMSGIKEPAARSSGRTMPATASDEDRRAQEGNNNMIGAA
jgi:hypothetical protein